MEGPQSNLTEGENSGGNLWGVQADGHGKEGLVIQMVVSLTL